MRPFVNSLTTGCTVRQEYWKSFGHDKRRATMKEPLAPATKGLKKMMQKLGALNKRHEDLVERVDELEASLLFVSFLPNL